MNDFGQILLIAFALMMVLEGVGPFVLPSRWRQTINALGQLPDDVLRVGGLVVMVLGLVLLYVAKG